MRAIGVIAVGLFAAAAGSLVGGGITYVAAFLIGTGFVLFVNFVLDDWDGRFGPQCNYTFVAILYLATAGIGFLAAGGVGACIAFLFSVGMCSFDTIVRSVLLHKRNVKAEHEHFSASMQAAKIIDVKVHNFNFLVDLYRAGDFEVADLEAFDLFAVKFADGHRKAANAILAERENASPQRVKFFTSMREAAELQAAKREARESPANWSLAESFMAYDITRERRTPGSAPPTLDEIYAAIDEDRVRATKLATRREIK